MKTKFLAMIILSIMLLASCMSEQIPESSLENRESSVSDYNASTEVSQDDESEEQSTEILTTDENSNSNISQAPVILIEPSKYNYQAVYTDKLRRDGIYPYSNLINSAEQMQIYTNEIKENDVYDTDRSTLELPSYDEWVTKYTEEWFEENSLIIVVIESDSKIIPSIEKIQMENDSRIDIHLAKETLGSETDQVYTVFLEMFKIDAEILNVFN